MSETIWLSMGILETSEQELSLTSAPVKERQVMQDSLFRFKDSIAREHDYDIESLAAYLQPKQRSADQQVVDLRTLRRTADQGAAKSQDKHN